MCTQGDTCQGGTCTPGPTRSCAMLDTACVLGVCNPTNGNCQPQNRPSNTVCNDSNACTASDHCMNGACVGTNQSNVVCTDSNACTTGDMCQAGVCVPGAMRDCETQCATATCNPSTGVCGAYTDRLDNLDCADNDVCDFFDHADCFSNQCGTQNEYACPGSWEHDGDCDCGCQFGDIIDCGLDPDICDYYGTLDGSDCPNSGPPGQNNWEGDGECDCACNFDGEADIDCLNKL
jgi:hypothetical protein